MGDFYGKLDKANCSRRGFLAFFGVSIPALALVGCTVTGPNGVVVLTAGAQAVLANVVAALQAVANGVNGVMAQLVTMTGVTISTQIQQQISNWIQALDQFAMQLQSTVVTAAQASTLIQEAEAALNSLVSAAGAFGSLIPGLGTALGYANILLPFLEEAYNYLTGVSSVAPTVTAPVATTAAAKAKFGALRMSSGIVAAPSGATPAQAIAYLNSLAVKVVP